MAGIPLNLRVGAATHRGLVRSENQDRIRRFISPLGEVFLVADGMGGHKDGALAAELLVEGMERHLRELAREMPAADALRSAAAHTNDDIRARAGTSGPQTSRMGATGVLALVSQSQAVIAHAGDSRAYLLRGGVLSRLTRDHTLVQRMLDHNMLTEEEARDHPDSNVVTRAFGSRPAIDLEVSEPWPLQAGDRLLLCSDGLSGYVEDNALQRVLTANGDTQEAADALIDLALKAGGLDNVSVQVVAAQGAEDGGPNASSGKG